MTMLRFLTTVSLCAISFNSYAADLSARPTGPAMPQTYNWTGLYAGAQLGYADGNTANAYSFLMINPPHTRQPWYVDGVNNYGGITGGGHVGYLYQGNSNFVLDVEADYSAANITGDDKGAMGGVNTRKIDQLGTVKGRFGVGFDRTLIYMTAGYAYGHVEAGDTRLPETDSCGCPDGPWAAAMNMPSPITGAFAASTNMSILAAQHSRTGRPLSGHTSTGRNGCRFIISRSA